jgi:hypothetical protein
MTRKDYIALAGAIRETRELVLSPVAVSAVESVTQKIADALAADNGRFDRERFYAACEPRA